jgi:hypothetical protein
LDTIICSLRLLYFRVLSPKQDGPSYRILMDLLISFIQ